jgi:hypothetical protein
MMAQTDTHGHVDRQIDRSLRSMGSRSPTTSSVLLPDGQAFWLWCGDKIGSSYLFFPLTTCLPVFLPGSLSHSFLFLLLRQIDPSSQKQQKKALGRWKQVHEQHHPNDRITDTCRERVALLLLAALTNNAHYP